MSRLPEPGETWNARYEIRSVLGRGGFGRVYRAWDPLLERDVAIKMLRLSEDFTPTDHQRFRRETNIAAGLEHRHIVTVYDGGEHEGLLFLVMRFVAGRDLRFELEQGRLSPRRTASIVRQVGDALDYAHGKGLVHRDVKPGNILCQADSDTVFLADFGISRRVDQTTDNPVTQGLAPATLAYAAPEQMRTDVRVDARADIYALGCVLFECLTGAKPFDGEMAAMINAHLHEPPPRPSERDASLSRTWDRVVATALAKDPADRFQRCGELVSAVAFAVPPEVDDQADEAPATTSAAAVPRDRTTDDHAATANAPGARHAPPDDAAAAPRTRTRHLDRSDVPTRRTGGAPAPAAGRGPGSAQWSPTADDGPEIARWPPSGADAPSPRNDAGAPAAPPPASQPPPSAPSPPAPRTTAPARGMPSSDTPAGRAAPPSPHPRPYAAPAPSQALGDRSSDAGADAPPARGGGAPDVPDQRGRRTGLAVIAAVVVSLLIWFAWPLLSPDDTRDQGGDGGDAAADDAGGGAADAALDDAQLALLDEFGTFEPGDCRPPVREPLADQGVEVNVACASEDQVPTRVVFRRFGSTTLRDAALQGLAGGTDGGDCRDDRRANHAYTGDGGEGRVVCAVTSSTAGLSWSVPGGPVMGSARLDDPDRAGDLYTWWAELVGRSDG